MGDKRESNVGRRRAQIEQRRRQQRVAEITEMIHVASLMHDDVIDTASTRRGLQALNSVFGNKVRWKRCTCVWLLLFNSFATHIIMLSLLCP